MSAILPPQPVTASPEVMGHARENCAARLRLRGQEQEAEAFALGLRDDCWMMKHEVSKLLADEAARGLAAQ